MKYYECKNASRPVKAGGLSLQFTAYRHFAGAWLGVFASDNAQEIAELSWLVSDPASGVKEITADEYAVALKKKAPTSTPYIVSPPSPRQPKTAVVADRAGRLVEGGKGDVPIEAAQSVIPEKIEDVLKVGQVKPHETTSAPAKPKKSKKKKISEDGGGYSAVR